ncbi:MAG: hypothetical protein KDD62_14120, partial [Bdellovibrionales bacterium]|nr:hypothetical protein [Bdellovibrionales bacterium]
PALLSDHAHLERKAAANALSLMHRWPEQCADPNLNIEWVGFLAEVARDEVAHLELVASILNQRGAIFGKYHDNAYAQGLREYERRGEDAKDLVDRLIVSALIEARSCERFHLLSIASADQELAKLYRGLWSSEHGHYKMFLELAMRVMDRTLVEARWKEYLDIEAAVIQAQSPGSRVHSWISPEGY